MKKLALGLTACALGALILGCGVGQGDETTISSGKMTQIENTITSSENSNRTKSAPKMEKTAVTNGFNPYGNVNTYALPPFGFGFYPMAGFGGYTPMGNYMPMNGAYGYNPYFGGGYNTMGYGSNNAARWGSNINTYRINSITRDGVTTTTIDSYHNGEPTGHEEVVTEQENQDESLESLNQTLFASTLETNLAHKLRNEILSSLNTLNSLNEKDEDTLSKTNHSSILNVTHQETNQKHKSNPSVYKPKTQNTEDNSKYAKLQTTDNEHPTQNSSLQNLLKSLIEMENCLNGNCGFNYGGSAKNTDWASNCPNGECSNCTNCTSCATCQTCTDCTSSSGLVDCSNCSNCFLCTDCKNCDNCFNCTDCENCSNLANVSGYRNNKPCEDCQNAEINNGVNDNSVEQHDISDNTPIPQMPSTGSAQIESGEASHSAPTELDANQTVRENLVQDSPQAQPEILPADENIANQEGEPVKSFSEDDKSFNTNPNENEKNLTA